jgi:hypothetical protein
VLSVSSTLSPALFSCCTVAAMLAKGTSPQPCTFLCRCMNRLNRLCTVLGQRPKAVMAIIKRCPLMLSQASTQVRVKLTTFVLLAVATCTPHTYTLYCASVARCNCIPNAHVRYGIYLLLLVTEP